MRPVTATPEIFAFTSLREYLDAYVASKRAAGRGAFTFRQFAKRAGVPSPNYLQRVLGGKKLGARTTERFIQALGLRGDRAQYFRILVLFSQAGDTVQKLRYLDELERLRGRQTKLEIPETLDNSVWKSWYTPVIWELASCRDAELSPEAIARHLVGRVTEVQAERALAFLVDKGYLVALNEPHRYRQAPLQINSTDEMQNLYLSRCHKRYMEFAIERLSLDVHDRDYRHLTIAVSKDKMELVKARAREFLRDLARELANDPDADRVVQIQLQAFPVTDPAPPRAPKTFRPRQENPE